MGKDPKAPTARRQLANIAKGLRESYPGIVRSLGEQTLPSARYEQGAREEIAPREQALSSRLFSQYAPEYARTGAGIDLSAIQGAGGQSVLAADVLDRSIDPEYYAARAGSAQKLAQLLGGIDPNRLTGAEREDVARGLARSRPSEIGVPSNQGAIEAALTYGSALNQKRNTVANAINTASGAIPGLRSGKDVFGQATQGARFGVNPFSSGQGFGGTAGQAGQEGGQNVLGITGGLQSLRAQLNAQRRDTLDRTNETFSSSPITCCFIFLEAYNGQLPWYVRVCRDYWYERDANLAAGYKKMAKWLVPLMRESRLVAWLVNTFMVQPISRIGKFLVGESAGYSKIDLWLHNAWFKVWRFYANWF